MNHKDTNNARCKAKFNGNHGRNKEKSTVHTVPPFKPLQFLTGLIWTAILAVQPSDPVDIWLTSLLIATDSRSWTTADTETWTEKTFTFRSVDKGSCATSIESIARVYLICQTPTFLENPQRIPPIQPTSCDRPSETGAMGETSEKGAWAIALSRPGTGIVHQSRNEGQSRPEVLPSTLLCIHPDRYTGGAPTRLSHQTTHRNMITCMT